MIIHRLAKIALISAFNSFLSLIQELISPSPKLSTSPGPRSDSLHLVLSFPCTCVLVSGIHPVEFIIALLLVFPFICLCPIIRRATSLSLFTVMHWRRKRQPTPVFQPGESQGRGAWWAAVYGVAQSRTPLKRLSSSSSPIIFVLVSLHHFLFLSIILVAIWEEAKISTCDWKSKCKGLKSAQGGE